MRLSCFLGYGCIMFWFFICFWDCTKYSVCTVDFRFYFASFHFQHTSYNWLRTGLSWFRFMSCSGKSPLSLMDLLPLPDWDAGRLRLSRSLSKKRMRRRGIRGSRCQDLLHTCTSPLLLEKDSKHLLYRVVVCFIVEPENTASASRLSRPGTVRQLFVFAFLSYLCLS